MAEKENAQGQNPVTSLKPNLIQGQNKEEVEVTNPKPNLIQGQNKEEVEVTNPVPGAADPKPTLIQGQNKEEVEVTNPVPGAADPKPTEAPIGAANPAPNLPERRLTVEEEAIKEDYLWCARELYSLPEMIKFMTGKYGVAERSVIMTFNTMMGGMNAERYLRASAQRSRERAELEALLQRFGSSSSAETRAPSQSDGASSSRGRGRN